MTQTHQTAHSTLDPTRPQPTEASRRAEALAREHGIQSTPLLGDRWVDAIARQSGDEAHTDATADILVALRIKNVITSQEMVKSLSDHNRELGNDALSAPPGA